LLAEPEHRRAERLCEQFLLAAEVVVDRAGRYSGRVGNVLHGGLVVARTGEDGGGGVDDLTPTRRAVRRARSICGIRHTRRVRLRHRSIIVTY